MFARSKACALVFFILLGFTGVSGDYSTCKCSCCGPQTSCNYQNAQVSGIIGVDSCDTCFASGYCAAMFPLQCGGSNYVVDQDCEAAGASASGPCDGLIGIYARKSDTCNPSPQSCANKCFATLATQISMNNFWLISPARVPGCNCTGIMGTIDNSCASVTNGHFADGRNWTASVVGRQLTVTTMEFGGSTCTQVFEKPPPNPACGDLSAGPFEMVKHSYTPANNNCTPPASDMSCDANCTRTQNYTLQSTGNAVVLVPAPVPGCHCSASTINVDSNCKNFVPQSGVTGSFQEDGRVLEVTVSGAGVGTCVVTYAQRGAPLPGPGHEGKLSHADKAGIAIGVIVGVVIVAGAVFVYMKSRQQHQAAASSDSDGKYVPLNN